MANIIEGKIPASRQLLPWATIKISRTASRDSRRAAYGRNSFRSVQREDRK